MYPDEAELALRLRDNPSMSRPVADKPLGSGYAVSLYVRAAYGPIPATSTRRDLEVQAALLRSVREPGLCAQTTIVAA